MCSLFQQLFSVLLTLQVVLGGQREEALLGIRNARRNPVDQFYKWVQEQNKHYSNDSVEYNRRFQIWKDNVEFVYRYNSPEKKHWLGINSMADLTQEEYRAKYLGFNAESALDNTQQSNQKPRHCKYCHIPIDDLPKSVDFRQQGVVTNIKNQEQCGSCWAFSATASVESVNAQFGEPLISLSEQEILDCDHAEDACQGGTMDAAFKFVIQNRGLDTYQNYKYIAQDERCNIKKEDQRIVTIQKFQDVPENNETALMQAAANQVISVAIEADQRPFQMYKGGIFQDTSCGTSLDHGVNIVGYGSQEGTSYWIVRNSWGSAWGDNGYILMEKDISSSKGICGIAMMPSFPIKTKPNPIPPPPSPSPPGPNPGPGPAPSPPTPPGPNKCDIWYSCKPGQTCCCEYEAFDICLLWGCCPYANAVCCSDRVHCCPQHHVCDLQNGGCIPKNTVGGKLPWAIFEPVENKKPVRNIFEQR
eukprot:TRINITY_DN6146_c0_g1_i1.p1 TRINITY_DN6146_c0_g1~~TRINITY_DN6146_c0_g1_i1.p1  ORF type:complete len:474 (+),score=43.42 TRINITY_DN6146_c0_g1_i1:155-1576(+)